MTQTDAEDRLTEGDDVLDEGNGVGHGRRVARPVGNHPTSRVPCGHLLEGGSHGKLADQPPPLREAAGDVLLVAQVEEGDAHLGIGIAGVFGLRPGHLARQLQSLHGWGRLEALEEVGLGSSITADEGVHGPAITDVLNQAPGVDVGDADDAIPLEAIGQGLDVPHPTRNFTEVADN